VQGEAFGLSLGGNQIGFEPTVLDLMVGQI
jgi:hypothetical protein